MFNNTERFNKEKYKPYSCAPTRFCTSASIYKREKGLISKLRKRERIRFVRK
jgi:hypothetical protein